MAESFDLLQQKTIILYESFFWMIFHDSVSVGILQDTLGVCPSSASGVVPKPQTQHSISLGTQWLEAPGRHAPEDFYAMEQSPSSILI